MADPRLFSTTARHRFDPVSFVLGSVAVAAGVIVLAGGSLLEDAALLLPAGLIALGVALLLRIGWRRDLRPAPAVPEPTPPPGSVTMSGAELYDLLVPDPTESFVAEMEARKRWAESTGDDSDDRLDDDSTVEIDGPAEEADSTADEADDTEQADGPEEHDSTAEAEDTADEAGPIARPDDDAGPVDAGASGQT